MQRNGRPVAGFGVGVGAPVAHEPEESSPWKAVVLTTIIGTATGWVLEEIARRTFRKRRR